MQCTRRLLGPPGVLSRSVQDFKRFVQMVTQLEAITGPTQPFDLINFKDRAAVDNTKTMSDADMGGFSTVNLDWQEAKDDEPAHVRFHGNISIDLPLGKPHIVRSGYSGWATLDRKASIFGHSYWNTEPYTHLCLKVKTDGRKYFVNLRTDSIVPTDLHQHRLITRQTGKWETVVIDMRDFVRTNLGEVVNPQSEMLRDSVKSVGVSLTDRIPKPYELLVSRIWLTNQFKGDSEFGEGDPLHRAEDWDKENELAKKPVRRKDRLGDEILM